MTRFNRYAWIIGVLTMIVAISLLVQQKSVLTLQAATFDPTLRSVVVVRPGEQIPPLKPGFIRVDLIQGSIPSVLSTGIVRTDLDCEPDQQGVSHCRNLVMFGDSEVEVRHHHAMMEEPCLTPNEAVNLMSGASYATLQTTRP